MNITESAGVDKSTTVGAMLNTFVGGNSMMNVAGMLYELVTGERKSQAKKAINNHESHEMNVEKDKNIHTEGKFVINASEKSNLF
jgi:type VI secretion system secreted protein VgrG